MADLEVAAQNPDALAVLLDENGNLSEGKGSNIFIVSEGRLRTPRERYVLPGVSRAVTMDLAGKLGIEVEPALLRRWGRGRFAAGGEVGDTLRWPKGEQG